MVRVLLSPAVALQGVGSRRTQSSRVKFPLGAVREWVEQARAFHRIQKLARTIADLSGEETIEPAHLAEALQYRLRA